MKNSLLVFSVAFFLMSCTIKSGSGVIIEEARTIDDFHAISVGQGIRLIITASSTPSVKVSADDNLIDLVITEVVAGELRIRFQDKVSLSGGDITIYVADNGRIDKISSGSGADVESEGILKHDRQIEFNVHSGSKLDVRVDAPEINMDVSGGSSVEIAGLTRRFVAESGGGSTIDAEDLKSEEMKLSASSGSSVRGFASVTVKAEASSGANIIYDGPTDLRVSKSESSGGSVRSAK